MSPKARKLLLSQILKASYLADLNPDHWHFTCNCLLNVGVSTRAVDAYWDQLFFDSHCPHNCVLNNTAANCFEVLGYGRLPAPELHEVQLMMLAWFHEMVRSKEFDQFL